MSRKSTCWVLGAAGVNSRHELGNMPVDEFDALRLPASTKERVPALRYRYKRDGYVSSVEEQHHSKLQFKFGSNNGWSKWHDNSDDNWPAAIYSTTTSERRRMAAMRAA